MMCAGMLRVPGLLPGKAKMFDTPGVPHDHQMAALLTPDEVHPVALEAFSVWNICNTCHPSQGVPPSGNIEHMALCRVTSLHKHC